MASGGQYVTHTGPTVMPPSYADSWDWGEGSLTEPNMTIENHQPLTALNLLLTKPLETFFLNLNEFVVVLVCSIGEYGAVPQGHLFQLKLNWSLKCSCSLESTP